MDLDGLVGNSSYLLAYDSYHGDLLVSALGIIAAVLPGITALFLLYSLVTSFIQVMVTDRAFIRWGINTGLCFFFMIVVLGGISLPSNGHESLTNSNTDGQVTSVYLFRKPAGTTANTPVQVYGSTPFEAFAYLPFGADSFAYDIGENSCQTYDSTSSATLYVSSEAVHNSMLGTVSARLQQTNLMGGLLRYMTNSSTAVMYASSHLANANLIHSSFLRYIKNLMAESGQEVPSLFSSEGIAQRLFPEVYYDEVYALSNPEILNMINKLGNVTRSYNLQMDSVTSAYSSTLSAFHQNSQQAISLANVDEAFDYARSSASARVDDALRYSDGQAAFVNFRSQVGTFMAACRTENGYDASTSHFGGQSLYELLNPCSVVRDDLEVLQFDSSVFDSAPTMTIYILGIAIPINIASFGDFSITPDYAGLSCTNLDTIDDLQAAYATVSLSSVASNTHKACLDLGTELAQNIKDMYTHSDAALQAFDAQMVSNGRVESREDTAVLAVNFESAPPAGGSSSDTFASTLGNENQASLNGALRSMLGPLANKWSSQNLTAKSPAAITNSGAQKQANGTMSDANVRELKGIASGAVAALAGGAKVAGALGSTLVSWPIKIGMIIAGTIPSGAVMTSYTVVYYTAAFGSAFALIFLPFWCLMTCGKMMSAGANSSDRYQGFASFPLISFIMTPVLVASELALVGIANGMSLEFFNHSMENMCGVFLSAVLTLGAGSSLFNAANIPSSAALDLFVTAIKPLGVMLGFAIMPSLLYKLTKGDIYSTENDLADRSLIQEGANQAEEVNQRVETMLRVKQRLQNRAQQAAGDVGKGAASTVADTLAGNTASGVAPSGSPFKAL